MVKFAIILSMIVLINLIEARLSQVPPPPKRPERFHSREELKRYLQKVHEYHSIVGRWRLRRDLLDQLFNEDLFGFLDESSIPGDDLLTKRSQSNSKSRNRYLN